MTGTLERAALAAALGLAVLAGLARAQEHLAPVVVSPSGPVLVHQGIPGPGPQFTSGPFAGTDMTYAPEPPPRPRPVCDWLRKCNLACWSHINYMGCDSLPQTYHFMFGSCRTFFGEPCLNGPGPAIVPASIAGSVDVTGRNGRQGCNCP